MICSAVLCEESFMDNDELDSPGKRLKYAREKAGFETAADFAKRISENPTSYRAYENDQNGFSKKAHTFAGRLNVNAEWLLYGGDLPVIEEREDAPLEHQARKWGLAMVPELELGYSMGGGSVFTEYKQSGFLPFQRDWLKNIIRGHFSEVFVARGEGDSMGNTIFDGDIVLIDTAQRDITQQDRIWALSYGELGMIKRVRRLPGGTYRIMSDNPAVADFDASDGEMYVVGRVCWIGRKM